MHRAATGLPPTSAHKFRLDIIRDMTVFVEVGRHENFTQAADALGVPLSTLARRIANLEEKLGMRLVERSTRRQRLTPDGQIYFERCRHIVEDALTVYEEVHAQSHGVRGHLTLMVQPDVFGGFFADAIDAFMREFPSVTLSVELGGADVPFGDKPNDLLIRIGEPQNPSLVTRRVGAMPLGLFASPSYLQLHGAVHSRQDLRSKQMLIADCAAGNCATLLRDLTPEHINLGGRIQSSTFALLAGLANAGRGIAVLPTDLAAPFVQSGTLRPVLDTLGTSLPIHVVSTSKLLPVRARTFLRFISTRLWGDPLTVRLVDGEFDAA